MRRHHRLAITSLGMGVAEFGDVAHVVSLAASPYLSGPRSAIHVGFAATAYGVGSSGRVVAWWCPGSRAAPTAVEGGGVGGELTAINRSCRDGRRAVRPGLPWQNVRCDGSVAHKVSLRPLPGLLLG